MTTRNFGLLALVAGAFIAGCGSGSDPEPISASTSTVLFEGDCISSSCVLSVDSAIVTTLERRDGGDYIRAVDDQGASGVIGEDSYPLRVDEPLTVDLCFVLPGAKATATLLGGGKVLATMHAQETGYDCSTDNVTPVDLAPGEYQIRLASDAQATRAETIVIALAPKATTKSALKAQSAAGTVSTGIMINVGAAPDWSATKSYGASSIVKYKGAVYSNAFWASEGMCPIAEDCRASYTWTKDEKTALGVPWRIFDPTVKHEFAYYDYEKLITEYPALKECTPDQYALTDVRKVIDDSATNGEIFLSSDVIAKTDAKPNHREALYREYMLPCRPNFTSHEPDNVKTIRAVMPLETWKTYTQNATVSEAAKPKYTVFELTATPDVFLKTEKPFPFHPSFTDTANTYESFLKAAARYPYFCGDKGYFPSVGEACKREIASLFGHVTQETGNTDIMQAFAHLREGGYPNSASVHEGGCGKVFDCAREYQRYYGRGPKQLTHAYNYGGFSASYFNGDFAYLLKQPDMVAYDPDLFFASALWFTMANQPPKPSIHDVMVGRYKPDAKCTTAAACLGVIYDATTGVRNNFELTIEIINGGLECRDGTAHSGPANRIKAYKTMLGALNATLTPDEIALQPRQCSYGDKDTKTNTIFGKAELQTNLLTWIDLDAGTCKATNLGGTATVSVTATGVVTACRTAWGMK